MSKPTLRELLQCGEVDRLLAHLGSWQAVALHLGVNERTLRRARQDALQLYRSDDEAAPVEQPVYTSTWSRGILASERAANDNDFAEEEPTQPGWSWPEAVNDNWRSREEPSSIKKLTKAECPDGTLILWASDIHIPIHNEAACRLMVECAERAGVKRAVIGGDGLDLNCLSNHAKESRRTVEHATILEEVEPGRWLLNYLATKETDWLLGNHEERLKRFIDENPAFHGSVAGNFARMVEMPSRINVLDGEVRLGNLSMFHGHREFKNGTGGKYPAQKILDMFPDQSSMHGHLHREGTAYRTTKDENGVNRTRRAYSMGHMSLEHMHDVYMSRVPNWQTGFGLIRVWWEDDRPRWTVYQVEVQFDRYNRPYAEFEGRVYR